MTTTEKKALNLERKKAVRLAWQRERELVLTGKGTIDLSAAQQRELVETGHVKGYCGHHMMSCKLYPEHAGNPDNIQILSKKDHLLAHKSVRTQAHDKDGFHSLTNGYYDPHTGITHEFGDRKPQCPPVIELTDRTLSREHQQIQSRERNAQEIRHTGNHLRYSQERSDHIRTPVKKRHFERR